MHVDTVAPVFRGDAEEAARACVARSEAQCGTQARSARGSRFPFYCLRGAPLLRATAALWSQKHGAQRPTLESHPWRRSAETLQLIFPQLRGVSSLPLEAKNHGTSTSQRASVQSNRRIKFWHHMRSAACANRRLSASSSGAPGASAQFAGTPKKPPHTARLAGGTTGAV